MPVVFTHHEARAVLANHPHRAGVVETQERAHYAGLYARAGEQMLGNRKSGGRDVSGGYPSRYRSAELKRVCSTKWNHYLERRKGVYVWLPFFFPSSPLSWGAEVVKRNGLDRLYGCVNG